MGRSRQGSMAWRRALGAFAIYAVLLQGFVAASAPAAGFADGVICAEKGSGQGTSGGTSTGHHHGLCCILACAAAGCAYTGTSSPLVFFPDRRPASVIRLSPAPVLAARPLLNYCFSARGPPKGL